MSHITISEIRAGSHGVFDKIVQDNKLVDPPEYKSLIASVKRTRANCKAYICANQWDYFSTFTFFAYYDAAGTLHYPDYSYVYQNMRHLQRDIDQAGGKILYIISAASYENIHVHAVLHNVPHYWLVAGIADRRITTLKTEGSVMMLRNSNDYNIGHHVIQAITTAGDYNRIADYMVAHFLPARAEDKLLDWFFGRSRRASLSPRLYFHSRGLKKSKRIAFLLTASQQRMENKIRLYINGDQKPALVAAATQNLLDLCRMFNMDFEKYYAKGNKHIPQIRVLGILSDLLGIIVMTGACIIKYNNCGKAYIDYFDGNL